jgi:choline dehydrogenase
MHMTVGGGVRSSTSNAYIKPAKNRSNLKILTNVLVQKVILENKIATGVEYSINGNKKALKANREVILCAGSIGSPQLLQLSGIGPKKVLDDAGVDVLLELPGVGENLQDHLEVYFQYHCKKPITLNSKLNLFSKGLIGIEWILAKTGLGATNHFESCGFIRSRAGLKWPNIQYHFLPAAMRYDGNAAMDGHGYQVHAGVNKVTSRGNVRINSSNPKAKPTIIFNYMETEQDRQDWRDCIRLTREILSQPALDDFNAGEASPGIDVSSDEEIDAWVRANVESAYHPSCSCKMGSLDDPMTVVNNEGQVNGIENLRVIDSSVFPTIPNGNLNGPTIMLAEKMADSVLGKKPLISSDVNVWIDSSWKELQRLSNPKRKVTQD